MRESACQRGLTERQALWGGGALERGHGAPLERLTQLGDALGSVGAGPHHVDAAELVVFQAATGRGVSMGADRERRTLWSWFERRGERPT